VIKLPTVYPVGKSFGATDFMIILFTHIIFNLLIINTGSGVMILITYKMVLLPIFRQKAGRSSCVRAKAVSLLQMSLTACCCGRATSGAPVHSMSGWRRSKAANSRRPTRQPAGHAHINPIQNL